nr:NAD-dependent epimerase/dehydratase family protein [uncultured Rhodoferax sp.]
MPSNQTPLGALPARFRRERVLIVGCGDVGLRVAQCLRGRVRLLALTSQPGRAAELRASGITPLQGNLDVPDSLRRLAGLATRLVHLAPPPQVAKTDPRTQALVRTLRLRSQPRSAVYGSTSGVYGDCGGAWVAETRPQCAVTPRAERRTHAEAQLRFWGLASFVRMSILRIPGIYAPDREGGTPRARLLRGTPVLRPIDDVYTNHIHADDLARACCLALWRGASQRIYNVNDDSDMLMGDYFDLAADLYGLPRPPRIARAEAAAVLAPALLSFMNESRRMVNFRMKRELRLSLRYPTVHTGLV